MIIEDLEEMVADWRCPLCGDIIEHSYLALVEVGTPICDCGEDMELITDE